MKLEITQEKVLEAAEKCSEAKEVLKTLFPEAFEKEDEFVDITDKVFVQKGNRFNNIYLSTRYGESPQILYGITETGITRYASYLDHRIENGKIVALRQD